MPSAPEEISRQRLYPPITNPNWLVLRARRMIFERWLREFSVKDALVLDVGGRHQPYRPLFRNPGLRYVAVDLHHTALVDVIADGGALPFADDGFDLVICTQVLEYVREPCRVVAEMHRVLRPGGLLLLSAPAIYPIDSDHDAWRFLPSGLRHLAREFAAIEVVAEDNTITGLLRTLNVYLFRFAHFRVLRRIFVVTLIPMINGMAYVLGSVVRTKNDLFSTNFSLWARK